MAPSEAAGAGCGAGRGAGGAVAVGEPPPPRGSWTAKPSATRSGGSRGSSIGRATARPATPRCAASEASTRRGQPAVEPLTLGDQPVDGLVHRRFSSGSAYTKPMRSTPARLITSTTWITSP